MLATLTATIGAALVIVTGCYLASWLRGFLAPSRPWPPYDPDHELPLATAEEDPAD